MNRELKVFEKLDNTLCLNNIRDNIEFGIDAEEHCDCDDVVEMAESLEIVENALEEYTEYKDLVEEYDLKPCQVREAFLMFKMFENEPYYKYKKAWKIVKEKNVDIYELQECKSVEQYNKKCDWWGIKLTQKEFDLLKEMLTNA